MSKITIYRTDGSVLLLTVEAATMREALVAAVAQGKDLSGAELSGADLSGADLIDGGQDRRGYRFWAWRRSDDVVVFRGGCREWNGVDAARRHFGAAYTSNGNAAECLARIALLESEAQNRGWLP